MLDELMAKTGARRVPEAQERLCSVGAHLTQPSLLPHPVFCPGVRLDAQRRPKVGEKANPCSLCPSLHGWMGCQELQPKA